MGWKTFKEKFQISHIVQVKELPENDAVKKVLEIRSEYIVDLVTVDIQNGSLSVNETFKDLVEEKYPRLLVAMPEEILEAIHTKDIFEIFIPVYTYENGQILEKFCEKLGWPNVTHDGCLMYENTHFAKKEDAIVKAKKFARSDVKYAYEAVQSTQEKLAKQQDYLSKCQRDLESLLKQYPDVPLSSD